MCTPNSSKKTHLQIATHGGGFDSRSWDVRINPSQHSYVDAALGAGYSILTNDRIGCDQSSKPDAHTDIQLQGQVEILKVLTEKARDGTISRLASNFSKSSSSNVAFDKIIHVGHSMGSIVSYGLLSLYPNVSDAAILTGFLINKEVFSARVTAN